MGNNIVVFASKEVGLEVVRFLYNNKYPIVGVVIADESQMQIKSVCKDNNIKNIVFDTTKIIPFLKELGAIKWLVNAWSPHYLKREVLDLFSHRVNIHPSFAPYCLGNDNAAWAIMEHRQPSGGGDFSRCLSFGDDR